MKLYNYALAAFLGLSAVSLTSCEDKLELTNPNQQTTDKFTSDDLEECVIAAYNHIRIEGSTGRVGYTIDLTRGDEVWNSSQVWYLEFDNFNAPITNDIIEWPWREAYYTINVCNFILSRTGNDDANLSEAMKRIKGQALFLRAFSYFNLAGYYQDVPLITDYDTYSTLDGLYGKNSSYDQVLDQVEADFKEAMTLLPSRDEGGEWAKGRATCGSAAGYYARALMQRHKYSEALTVLKDIIAKKYGKYDLVANYGDNFREGSAYENNIESLFEVQYLDYGTQGTDDEWTPVNTSPNATQGHAVESNFCPGDFGGWADLSASPWLYVKDGNPHSARYHINLMLESPEVEKEREEYARKLRNEWNEEKVGERQRVTIEISSKYREVTMPIIESLAKSGAITLVEAKLNAQRKLNKSIRYVVNGSREEIIKSVMQIDLQARKELIFNPKRRSILTVPNRNRYFGVKPGKLITDPGNILEVSGNPNIHKFRTLVQKQYGLVNRKIVAQSAEPARRIRYETVLGCGIRVIVD